jgi:quinolinate synthase
MAIDEPTVAATLEKMREKLHDVVPDFELKLKAELVYEINRLKKERGAIILGHNYMEPALFHTVPDHVGDSLGLSRLAATTDCDPIIFCGVRFMAETAKILNPSKTVLLPAKEAGCSLASSISAEDVRALREKYPGIPIIAYINTYADVKAEIDVCCTSGNAKQVVESFKEDTIIFLPDEYLAKNVAQETGKQVLVAGRDDSGGVTVTPAIEPPSGSMIAWHGKCEVHEKFTVEDVENVRKQFPDVEVIAHPECSPEVVGVSDYAGSTTQLVDYVQKSQKNRFLILTECAMGDNIIAENPGKEIVRLCSIRCPHMNEITLEDTLHALREDEQLIELPEDLRLRALKSVERMLEIG